MNTNNFLFISAPFDKKNLDGAQIYDAKLFRALKSNNLAIEHLPIERTRKLSLPSWSNGYFGIQFRKKLLEALSEGSGVIISHEAFIGLAHDLPTTAVIIHNYMPCFSFPEQRWLEAYYRLGSKNYFKKAFLNASSVIFLSHRDRHHALLDFPDIADRSFVLPPAPNKVHIHPRRLDIIHVSGSNNWLPKRLSSLNEAEVSYIQSSGYELSDFGTSPSPAFGLITDRFSVGFKLKLMQMIYLGDVIASFSDISDEIAAIEPNYPFWRQFQTVKQAVEWFDFLKKSEKFSGLDTKLSHLNRKYNAIEWGQTGAHFLEILTKKNATTNFR
ncbi:hypothetical protein [Hydrogenophaga taeniospiralis]|uniref:hypothetical protein n=1 Tax=Hydrogenophaga taeniospiralis TaxID=65656 RepID=UPI001CF98939|nr:hypothetical protein [Hydrogenophaga taeniospiralis]UCU92216.1 hypothetical protein KI616_15230 [Hydrogenophaga taeniospiralis]